MQLSLKNKDPRNGIAADANPLRQTVRVDFPHTAFYRVPFLLSRLATMLALKIFARSITFFIFPVNSFYLFFTRNVTMAGEGDPHRLPLYGVGGIPYTAGLTSLHRECDFPTPRV